MLDNLLTFQSLNVDLAYSFLILILAAVILLLSSVFFKLSRLAYLCFCAFSLIASGLCILYNVNEQGLSAKAFVGTLNLDLISFYASGVILLFSLLFILIKNREEIGEFYALFLFMIASFLLMVSSSNLVIIFIGLESSSLALYTLIAMQGQNNAIKAAIKYFSVAMISSAFFILGSAFFYLKTGSLDLQNTLFAANEFDIFTLSMAVLFFVILALKLSLIPFHFWLRDVYQASSASLVAFISVVPKIAIIAVTIRLFQSFANTGFEHIISIIAILSMLIAAMVALAQNELKKVLAYSSVVHSSFILAALTPLLIKNAEYNLSLIFAYWLLFGFANYAIFLILTLLRGTNYDSLRGLFKTSPFLAFGLAMSVLSLIGIPPFGVFWGKVMVMILTISAGKWLLAFFIAMASLIIIYAYLKIIIYAFFKDGELKLLQNINVKNTIIFAICVFISQIWLIFML